MENGNIDHDHGGELNKARAIMKSGRTVLFHSGLSSDAAAIGKHGLIPDASGPWVREIAMGAFDSDEDVDAHLEKQVPLVWLSSDPSWVHAKARRSIGQAVGNAPLGVVAQHAHLAIVDTTDYMNEIFKIGPDGLSNGAYSIVHDLTGKSYKFFETPLYAFDDERNVEIMPFGVERNEWISASDLDVAANLSGNDVIVFIEEFFPEIISSLNR